MYYVFYEFHAYAIDQFHRCLQKDARDLTPPKKKKKLRTSKLRQLKLSFCKRSQSADDINRAEPHFHAQIPFFKKKNFFIWFSDGRHQKTLHFVFGFLVFSYRPF